MTGTEVSRGLGSSGKRLTRAARRWVMDADRRRCVICRATLDLTLDHAYSKSMDRPNALDVLGVLCRSDNARRGDRDDPWLQHFTYLELAVRRLGHVWPRFARADPGLAGLIGQRLEVAIAPDQPTVERWRLMQARRPGGIYHEYWFDWEYLVGLLRRIGTGLAGLDNQLCEIEKARLLDALSRHA